MIAIMYNPVDSCKLHAVIEVKAKALTTGYKQTKSFGHMGIPVVFGYVANR